jgi:hypothetical protein
MRRRLGVLGTTTWVLLTAAVVVAAPAEARRNLGGTVPADAVCFSPGQTQARSAQANTSLSCFCYVLPPTGQRAVSGPEAAGSTTCPPGILTQGAHLDRRTGG